MKYKELVDFYIELSKTTKRLEKTRLTSEFLQKVPKDDLKEVIYLLQGKVFPDFSQEKLGISNKLIIKALGQTTGKSAVEIEEAWKKKGDLGETAKSLLSHKAQATLTSKELTVRYVFENLKKISKFEGSGSVSKKLGLISDLLSNAKPDEGVFIVRTLIGDLRVGIAAGILRDSIAWAFMPHVYPLFTEFGFKEKKGKQIGDERELEKIKGHIEALNAPDEKTARRIYNTILEHVQNAYDLTNDFAEVALVAKEDGLSGFLRINPTVGVPLRSMEAVKEQDIETAFKDIGKAVLVERKYDGYKLQIHKKGEEVWLFTRRQENVTNAFPEIVEAAKKGLNCKSCIVEGECVAVDPKTKRSLPFQNVSKRIKRKYEIEKIRKEVPVEIKLFDILYLNGTGKINLKVLERRRLLEKTVKPIKDLLTLSEQLKTEDPKKVEDFYKKALAEGYEGVMIKNPDAIYRPGRYVGFQYKLKPTLESLDLVIIGAEWGTGKRSGWMSSYLLACRNGEEYLACGKIGTGIKEKEKEGVTFLQMTKLLKKQVISEKGREVQIKPSIVVEVAYDEIQKSINYPSGYALRFPRVVRIRDDKMAKDANTLLELEHIYSIQKGKT